jgi:hypothetical protein
MTRLLKALDADPSGHDEWADRPARRSAANPGHHLASRILALLLAVVIGAAVVHQQFGVSITAHGLLRSAPLGRPPQVATGVGSYRYLMTQPHSNEPVAYDPCKPVEYVVNDALAPPAGKALLDGALREVSSATGLVFRSAGTTTDLPHQGESGTSTVRGPVLVAWTTPAVDPELDGAVAGVGGSAAATDEMTGRRRYVTGVVALDAPQLEAMLTTPDGTGRVRSVVMHELGHLVGLAHVQDRAELMYPENVGLLDFGPGDREGLAALGAGHCFH